MGWFLLGAKQWTWILHITELEFCRAIVCKEWSACTTQYVRVHGTCGPSSFPSCSSPSNVSDMQLPLFSQKVTVTLYFLLLSTMDAQWKQPWGGASSMDHFVPWIYLYHPLPSLGKNVTSRSNPPMNLWKNLHSKPHNETTQSGVFKKI